MSLQKRYVYFILLLLSVIFCKPTPTVETEILKVGIHSEPSKLDPIFAIDLYSQKLNRLIFRQLFHQGKNKEDNYALVEASEWRGQKQLYLKLQKTNSSHSIQIDAEDVQFCIERLIAEVGPRRSLYSAVIKKIEVLSTLEILLTYTSSKTKLIELLSLPPAAIYNKANFLEKKQFLSTGIYSIAHWDKNQSILLTRNESYPKKDMYPKTVNLLSVNESSNALFLFLKNELDVMKLPYFLTNHSVTQKGRIHRVKSRSVQYIAINHRKPCFDLNFRKALNHAIDKKKIIQKVFEKEATETVGPVPLEYFSMLSQEPFFYEYNLSLAKELLSKSKCYPQILEQPLELRMKADDENKAKGIVLSQFFLNLGLQVKIKPMEKVNLYKENSSGLGDLTLLTWFIDYDSVFNFIDPLFDSNSFGNAGNRSFYQNHKIDHYIETMKRYDLFEQAMTEEQTKETVNAIYTIYEDAPWVFLWSLNENYLISKKQDNLAVFDLFLF
jgi:peptide/nickel transport system substrate-binding protein